MSERIMPWTLSEGKYNNTMSLMGQHPHVYTFYCTATSTVYLLCWYHVLLYLVPGAAVPTGEDPHVRYIKHGQCQLPVYFEV